MPHGGPISGLGKFPADLCARFLGRGAYPV
jgi:hypothetical protein